MRYWLHLHISNILISSSFSLFVHITPSIRNSTKSTLANGLFTAQFRGLDFKNIESGILGLGAIDPYFELSKRYHDPSTGNIRWQLVYRSEYIHNIINPYWDAFQLDLEKLCHGELRRELKITVYDYEKKSAHRKLGEAEVTVEELMESVTRRGNASREHSLRILDKKGYVVGLIVVLKADVSSYADTDHLFRFCHADILYICNLLCISRLQELLKTNVLEV